MPLPDIYQMILKPWVAMLLKNWLIRTINIPVQSACVIDTRKKEKQRFF